MTPIPSSNLRGLIERLMALPRIFGLRDISRDVGEKLQEYCWQPFVASCPDENASPQHNHHHHHHHLLPPSSSSPSSSPSTADGLAEEYAVLMKRAYYGRMRQDRCLERNYFIGCSHDVISFLDRKCSGRPRCSVEIPNTELHKMQPCPKDLMAYLEAEYECIKVFKAADVTTCHVPVSLELSTNQGFLIDHVAGSYACAFIIGGQSGQRINVTLYDFRVHVEHGVPGRNKMAAEEEEKPSSCSHMTYGTVNELDRKSGSDWSKDAMKTEAEVLICGGGDKRERFVYMSKSNEVIVVLTNQDNDNNNKDVTSQSSINGGPRFILKFQAVGCADLTPPTGGWVVRTGETAVVYCNNTADVWHLVCNKNTWIGSYNNCTYYAKSYPGDSLAQAVNYYPVGIFVAVTIGIALGVFSGLLLLTIVICFQKKSTNQRSNKDYDTSPTNINATLTTDPRNKTHIILADKFYYDVTNGPANVCPCAIGRDSNLDPARPDSIGQTRLTSCENLLVESPCLSYREHRQPMNKRHELRPPLISVLQTSVGGVIKSDVIMGCEVVHDGGVIMDSACKPYGKLANNNSICLSGR